MCQKEKKIKSRSHGVIEFFLWDIEECYKNCCLKYLVLLNNNVGLNVSYFKSTGLRDF
jgi:hypothetical protein